MFQCTQFLFDSFTKKFGQVMLERKSLKCCLVLLHPIKLAKGISESDGSSKATLCQREQILKIGK